MTTTQPAPTTRTADPHSAADPHWLVAGGLLDALTRRDFDALNDYLDADVRFRALMPPAQLDLTGPAAVVETFRKWYGAHEEFAVLDAEVGQIGGRLSMRWRFWVRNAGAVQTVEQHVFVTVAERIVTLDLLCSGFQAEGIAHYCP